MINENFENNPQRENDPINQQAIRGPHAPTNIIRLRRDTYIPAVNPSDYIMIQRIELSNYEIQTLPSECPNEKLFQETMRRTIGSSKAFPKSAYHSRSNSVSIFTKICKINKIFINITSNNSKIPFDIRSLNKLASLLSKDSEFFFYSFSNFKIFNAEHIAKTSDNAYQIFMNEFPMNHELMVGTPKEKIKINTNSVKKIAELLNKQNNLIFHNINFQIIEPVSRSRTLSRRTVTNTKYFKNLEENTFNTILKKYYYKIHVVFPKERTNFLLKDCIKSLNKIFSLQGKSNCFENLAVHSPLLSEKRNSLNLKMTNVSRMVSSKQITSQIEIKKVFKEDTGKSAKINKSKNKSVLFMSEMFCERPSPIKKNFMKSSDFRNIKVENSPRSKKHNYLKCNSNNDIFLHELWANQKDSQKTVIIDNLDNLDEQIEDENDAQILTGSIELYPSSLPANNLPQILNKISIEESKQDKAYKKIRKVVDNRNDDKLKNVFIIENEAVEKISNEKIQNLTYEREDISNDSFILFEDNENSQQLDNVSLLDEETVNNLSQTINYQPTPFPNSEFSQGCHNVTLLNEETFIMITETDPNKRIEFSENEISKKLHNMNLLNDELFKQIKQTDEIEHIPLLCNDISQKLQNVTILDDETFKRIKLTESIKPIPFLSNEISVKLQNVTVLDDETFQRVKQTEPIKSILFLENGISQKLHNVTILDDETFKMIKQTEAIKNILFLDNEISQKMQKLTLLDEESVNDIKKADLIKHLSFLEDEISLHLENITVLNEETFDMIAKAEPLTSIHSNEMSPTLPNVTLLDDEIFNKNMQIEFKNFVHFLYDEISQKLQNVTLLDDKTFKKIKQKHSIKPIHFAENEVSQKVPNVTLFNNEALDKISHVNVKIITFAENEISQKVPNVTLLNDKLFTNKITQTNSNKCIQFDDDRIEEKLKKIVFEESPINKIMNKNLNHIHFNPFRLSIRNFI